MLQALILPSQSEEIKPAGSNDPVFKEWADVYSTDLPSPITPRRIRTRSSVRTESQASSTLMRTPSAPFHRPSHQDALTTPNTDYSFFIEPQQFGTPAHFQPQFGMELFQPLIIPYTQEGNF